MKTITYRLVFSVLAALMLATSCSEPFVVSLLNDKGFKANSTKTIEIVSTDTVLVSYKVEKAFRKKYGTSQKFIDEYSHLFQNYLRMQQVFTVPTIGSVDSTGTRPDYTITLDHFSITDRKDYNPVLYNNPANNVGYITPVFRKYFTVSVVVSITDNQTKRLVKQFYAIGEESPTLIDRQETIRNCLIKSVQRAVIHIKTGQIMF